MQFTIELSELDIEKFDRFLEREKAREREREKEKTSRESKKNRSLCLTQRINAIEPNEYRRN